ncbi:recombinase family protein [Nocardia sp. NPDC055002]
MENKTGLRVLGRIRLSRDSEESTSAERQREIIEQWCDMHQHRIVGWAVDLDVSRSVDPFDTPELGKWFTEEYRGSWDTVANWKLDRIATGSIYLNKVLDWCTKHDKSVVSVTESFDLSNWIGRLIANVIAGVAEGEWEAIKERTQASRRKLTSVGRWPGGRCPYGFIAVKQKGGGYKLEADPEARVVINRLIDHVLEHKPIQRIVNQLNEEGVPSPADRHRQLAGREIKKPAKWSVTNVDRMLRKKTTLLGHSVLNDITVRDENGDPVLIGPPIVDFDTFRTIQAELDDRYTPQESRMNASPLLGVLECFYCHKPQHHNADKTYRYYSCGARCKDHVHLNADEMEKLVEESVLFEIGDVPEQKRRFIPGQNSKAALDEAVHAMDELTTLLGAVTSDTMRKRLTGQISALDSKIAELENRESTPDDWEYYETGKTYGQLWSELGVQERRQLLIDAGVKVRAGYADRDWKKRIKGTIRFEVIVPDDILNRISV